VNADRICFVLFRVRLRFAAVEDIVCADMNQARTFRLANFREYAWRLRIERERFVRMRLAAIHVRLCRAVDQNTELGRAERLPEFRGDAQIELGVIEAK